MNFFSGIVLFFGLMMAISQVAPVVGDHYRAKEAHAHAVEFKAQKEARDVAACASGVTNTIMHNGVWCKK